MVRAFYAFLDRPVAALADDDVFVLCAARYWVLAAHDLRGARPRAGRCVRAMLRPGFALRPALTPERVDAATRAFAGAMALIDRHGWGMMRFLPLEGAVVGDDEARVLTLFARARVGDPAVTRIAASIVTDQMAPPLADAATRLGQAMRGG